MTIVIHIGIFLMNVIYMFIKLLPVQKKITYISRQSNTPSNDFLMVIREMRKDHPEYRHVILAHTLDPGLKAKILYIGEMFRQMYHIATSEAVILDSYCIAVSVLKQRKGLLVIQMWHALGAFKKFGYSILDQEEGSSTKLARLMHMHENYTYALASSEYTKKYFAEAFNMPIERMRIYPLPRCDLLTNEAYQKDIRDKIEKEYPALTDDKKVIVYAPTFRKTNDHLREALSSLIKAIDFDHYHLVFKPHPLTLISSEDPRVIVDQDFTSLEFFARADIIITDYSAVLFEALFLRKPIYFYDFDYATYRHDRSFYIDYASLPGVKESDAGRLVGAIEKADASLDEIDAFRKKMVKDCAISYTKDFTDFLYRELSKRRNI